MRKTWTLPAEDLLYDSGPEWLLHIVGTASVEEAARLMLVLWRAWFVRNEWVHAARWIRGDISVNFLAAYWESLSLNPLPGTTENKGKQAVSLQGMPSVGIGTRAMKPWEPPEEGWIKVNVDGAFVEQTGKAGVGVAI